MPNLLWLAEVARAAGLDVKECDGWQARGRTYCTMRPKGVVCHHTAGPAAGDMPSLKAENTGKDPWPKVQLDAYVVLVAAICEHLNIDTSMVAAHREWAPSRKPDPHSIDMDEFRQWVRDTRSGNPAAVSPPVQRKPDSIFEIGRVLVSQRINDFHPDVRRAQGLLAAYSAVGPGSMDGVAGPKFDKSVRAFQQQKGLTVDGEVGEITWRALEGAD
jgi:hypothetical protein